MEDLDPWDNFRELVKDSFKSRFIKRRKKYVKKGFSQSVAKVKAYNVLLPLMRKKLRQTYRDYVIWGHHLKDDPVHQAIKKTIWKLLDDEDEDMGYEEAVESAINQRKFLLNKILKPLPLPEEEEENEVKRMKTDDTETDETDETETDETDQTEIDGIDETETDETEIELARKAKTQGI